jgi:hypothetical protein
MKKIKRRPTLEQLLEWPDEMLFLEAAQIGVDAAAANQTMLELEATVLIDDPQITAEKVVALREKLQSATGCTVI